VLAPARQEAPQAVNRSTRQPASATDGDDARKVVTNREVEQYVREHPGTSHTQAFSILTNCEE